MKFNIVLFTLIFSIFSLSVHAKTVVDSVGVKNDDGKKVILFKVRPKDTYYSIGRRYHIKPAAIMKYNGSKKETLSIGAIISVPTDIPYKKSKEKNSEKAIKETKKEKKSRLAREAKEEKKKKYTEEIETPAIIQQQTTKQETKQADEVLNQPVKPTQEKSAPPLQYKVSAGETLYGISKRFNTTVDNIKQQNNLTSDILTAGQILNIKPRSEAPQSTTVVHTDMQVAKRDSTLVAPIKDSSNAERHLNANRFGIYEKNEKGVATWIDDAGLDPNKKLVLHRTAPIGTVI
ncbi:MAG: LysM peptidoglycan-binding domain-containing protein, partial [Bacteroidota bacterium]|nr:LysM peptidoglycan-binding domain-containing protein [Bacteroidota bacterium]